MNQLRVHCDTKNVAPTHLCALASLIDSSAEGNIKDVRKNRFERLALYFDYHFISVEIASAECVLLPFDLKFRETYAERESELAEQAAANNVPLIGFMVDDSETPLRPVHKAPLIAFRTSIRASLQTQVDELSFPGFCDDLVENHLSGEQVILPLQEIPSVGFVGFASNHEIMSPLTALKAGIVVTAYRKGYKVGNVGKYLRGEAIRKLLESDLVQTDIRVNTEFFHFVPKRAENPSLTECKRGEFIDNMVRNPYILAIRGNGNYSFRFFEALCMGRIPVLIEVDGKLPLEDFIDYSKHCVVVPFSERHNIAEYVQAFHSMMTDSSFSQIQRANRDLWLSHLSPEGFFAHLPTIVRRVGDTR